MTNKLKLLVVDDEPDNLDLLYRTFRKDFQVFKADNPLEALSILDSQGEMAIIISDQRMPLMSGTEFLGKTVKQFPNTIRILLTGYTNIEDLVDAINSGQVFKYLTKPWHPEDLKITVQQAADTYKILKQRTEQLTRALRQEELLNLITNTIRESLDYDYMLQTIVETIGQHFAATGVVLRPVEAQNLSSYCLSFQDVNYQPKNHACFNTQLLMEKVLETHQIQIKINDDSSELALPLIFQQQILAVLALYQLGNKQPWTDADLQLLQAVAKQAALAVSQAKLYRLLQEQTAKIKTELEVARQIQSNLLRQTWAEIEDVRIQAQCYPAREIGGDFFEVYLHPHGDIWLAVGDVSGKGVPAALLMASALSLLRRELTQEISPSPEIVLQNLNRIMAQDLFSTNCFITMVLARYHPKTRTLVYANAGHIYPLLWSCQNLAIEPNLQPYYLKVRSIPLGILPEWKAPTEQLVLNQKDILLLLSDGITEATITNNHHSDSNSILHQEGLWQLICQQSSGFDLPDLLTRFHQCTQDIAEDDQTILSLEVLS